MNAVSRVAIVGHSDLVRNGLEHILARYPEFEVVLHATAATPDGVLMPGDAIEAGELNSSVRVAVAVNAGNSLADPMPDGLPVLVLDLQAIQDRSRTGIGASISALSEHGRVLVVGDFLEPNELTGAMRAGAFGCVCRQVDEEELILAIRTVARGGMHVSPRLSALLHAELRAPDNPPPVILAPRETETLGWLTIGLTHREIASRMGLTEATVSTYVKRIRSKLNAKNKAELTRVAIELGLLDLERPTMLG